MNGTKLEKINTTLKKRWWDKFLLGKYIPLHDSFLLTHISPSTKRHPRTSSLSRQSTLSSHKSDDRKHSPVPHTRPGQP